MTAPHLLIFGKTGQLARELRDAALGRFHVTGLSHEDVDFSEPSAPARALTSHRTANIVINATGYTSVDKAENEEALATIVNGTTVGALAGACAARELPLIHVSTDYVFDGRKPGPYQEDDEAAPLNAYGRSKLAGELAVRAATDRHVILRTSWVYSPFGRNFVKTMLQLGTSQDEVTLVHDQRGNPTAAADIARAILDVATQLAVGGSRWGVFHYSGQGVASWNEFAEEIFGQARSLGWPIKARIVSVPSSARAVLASRPMNSVLDCSKIAAAYRIPQKPWQDSLAQVLKRLKKEGYEL